MKKHLTKGYDEIFTQGCLVTVDSMTGSGLVGRVKKLGKTRVKVEVDYEELKGVVCVKPQYLRVVPEGVTLRNKPKPRLVVGSLERQQILQRLLRKSTEGACAQINYIQDVELLFAIIRLSRDKQVVQKAVVVYNQLTKEIAPDEPKETGSDVRKEKGKKRAKAKPKQRVTGT